MLTFVWAVALVKEVLMVSFYTPKKVSCFLYAFEIFEIFVVPESKISEILRFSEILKFSKFSRKKSEKSQNFQIMFSLF